MFSMNGAETVEGYGPEELAVMKLAALIESATGRKTPAGVVADIVEHIIDAAVARVSESCACNHTEEPAKVYAGKKEKP